MVKAGVAMHVVEGVNEGIGRLRRGVGRVRSPRSAAVGASGGGVGAGAGGTSVPLEFDEEDEDFMLDEEARRGMEVDEVNVPVTEEAFVGSPDFHAEIDPPSHPVNIPFSGSLLVDFDQEPAVHVNQTTIGHDGGEGWEAGWEEQDRRVVEEAERYDEISAVGFMDEEQQEMRAEEMRRARAVATPSAGGKKGKRKKK